MNITGDSVISSKSIEIMAEETAESFKELLMKTLRIKILLLQYKFRGIRNHLKILSKLLFSIIMILLKFIIFLEIHISLCMQ